MKLFLIQASILVFFIFNTGCFKKKEVKNISRFPAAELGTSEGDPVPPPPEWVVEEVPENPLARPNPGANLGVSLPVGRGNFSQGCRSIITQQGNPGPAGRSLLTAMRRVEEDKSESCFYGDSGEAANLGKYCKGSEHFNSLTRAQKESLWLWFWASLAQVESSCNMNARYNGFSMNNSTAPMVYGGIFQLPTNSAHRELDNPVFCPENGAAFTVDFQANCAVSRFADLHCGEDPFRNVEDMEDDLDFTRQWVPLQPRTSISGRLKRLIRLHPLCS